MTPRTSGLQQTALGVIVGTPILAAVFVCLRVYSRRKLNVKLGWDDWTVVASLVLSFALIGPSWKFVKMWHVGLHIWEIPQHELEPDFDEYYGVLLGFNLINIPILPLVKVSMILLLLRIGSVISWLRKVLYGILVFNIGSSLIPWVVFIFICPPRTGNTWKPRTFGNLHCMGRYKMGGMLIWVTCANLLTDLLILPIPFIIVRRWLSGRWRSKLIVCAVFLCGLTVTAIGAAKIYLSYRDRLFIQVKADWTYDINYCINHIENNVAIIMANIPILRGLVTRFFSKSPRVEHSRASASRTHELLERDTMRIAWPWRKSTPLPGFVPQSRQSYAGHSQKSGSDQNILPCAQEDFDFDLLMPGDQGYPRVPSPVRTSSMFRSTRSPV